MKQQTKPLNTPTSAVDPRHIRVINNRHFITYAGLLETATVQNLTELSVEVLQYPTETNHHMAVCKAKASLQSGKITSDLGEASPETLDPRIAKFALSMAATRAKARALRNLLGVGITSVEELGSFTDVIGEDSNAAPAGQGSVNHTAPTMPTPATANAPNESASPVNASSPTQSGHNVRQFPAPANNSSPASTGNGNSVPATEAQLRAISSISRRRKLSAIELANFCKASLGMGLESLTKQTASRLIDQLKQAA